MAGDRAKALGSQQLFSRLSETFVGVEIAYMGEGPAVAIPKALRKGVVNGRESCLPLV